MTDALPAHSHLGASSCERWCACPGSIRLSAGLSSKSSFAAEGNAAHVLADECLKQLIDCGLVEVYDHIGREIEIEGFTFTVDQEMADAVVTYLEAIQARYEPGDEVESEVKFHLKDLHKDFFGTADCTIYKPAEKRLVVVDFKYGKGVPVVATDNPQLMYYGYGAATRKANRGVGRVDILIVQPRCPLPGDEIPGVRVWETDVVQLLDHSADLIEAARETEKPDAPLNPGDWCKFCPAAAVCPARRDSVMKAAQAEFGAGDLIVPEISTLTVEQRQQVLGIKEQLRDWLKRVEEFEHHEAEAGRPLAGWKLVAKRANRKWLDVKKAVRSLQLKYGLASDELYTEPELKSVAVVEKMIPKKLRGGFDALYDKKSSGTVLAPESDPRPAATSEAMEEFSA